MLSRVKQASPDVFSLGCVCHLANLCAAAGLKCLPVTMDDIVIDVFYYFKHSTKHWEMFARVQQDFDGIQPVRVLKHSTTRWLSIRRCLKRCLEQWDALYAFFDHQQDQEPRNERLKRLIKHMESPLSKLVCKFVLFALEPLNKFSVLFQTNASRVGTMQADFLSLFRSYLSNSLEPDLIRDQDGADLLDLDFSFLVLSLALVAKPGWRCYHQRTTVILLFSSNSWNRSGVSTRLLPRRCLTSSL